MKKLIIVCAVASLFAASGAVWAENGCGKGGPGQRGGMKGFGQGARGIGWLVHHEEVAKKLGVTEDQLSQLRDMAHQGRIAQIKGRAELEIAQMELRQLVDSDKPSEEAIGKAIDMISGMEAQLQKARIGEMLKARAILGEETMGKLRDAMREQMRDRGRRGDRQGMGPRDDDDGPGRPPHDDDDDKDE